MAQYSSIIKVGSFILLIVGMAVAATVWAASSHSGIEAGSSAKDTAAELRVRKHVKEIYTPLTHHVQLEQAFIDQKEDVKEIKEGVNDIKLFLYKRAGKSTSHPNARHRASSGTHTLP